MSEAAVPRLRRSGSDLPFPTLTRWANLSTRLRRWLSDAPAPSTSFEYGLSPDTLYRRYSFSACDDSGQEHPDTVFVGDSTNRTLTTPEISVSSVPLRFKGFCGPATL